jgi:RNA polymerase sigma-70 factor (ECF subfamily)
MRQMDSVENTEAPTRGSGAVRMPSLSQDHVARAWRSHRPYLVDLAFRMLGDIGSAEDVVQEAFARLLRARPDEIDNDRAWLIVVTSRLCLDQVRSARARREVVTEVGFEDTVPRGGRTPPAYADPVDRVTLDDNVRLALLVVLEQLTAAERVVFVLHDVFRMDFDSVATTVGRTSAACRQLARRARQKIARAEGAPRATVVAAEQRLVTETFIDACASGDVEQLLAVLAPDVTGDVDLIPSRIVVGAQEVAGNIMRYWAGRATLVSQPGGGSPAFLAFIDRRLAGVIVTTVVGQLITAIHVIADPGKLAFVGGQIPLMS